MAILKSINQNFKNLPDTVFWNRDRWSDHKYGFGEDWIRLTRNVQIRYVATISNVNQIQTLLDDKIISEKKLNHLTIIKNNQVELSKWYKIITTHFEEILKSKEFDVNTWQYFMIEGSDHLINPFSEKIPLLRRIRATKKSKIQRKYKRLESRIYLLQNNLEHKDQSLLLKQSRIKNEKKFNTWKSRLEKRGHSTTNIFEMSSVKVLRNHYTVNSNYNKSGKVIVTDENLILIRRKFSLLGLSFGSLLPLLAFVRPANKFIVIVRIFMEFLRVPFQIVRGLKPALSATLPAIGGLFVSYSFFNLNKVSEFFNDLFSSVVLQPVGLGIEFFVEHPGMIPAFFGVFTGIRFLLQRFLFRGEEIVILPHNLCTQLLLDGNQLIGRWKVKGSDLVNA
ncbi:MAG: hypothetical protein ACC656_10300, partial [Candidatus Heimdallarchaeota archaeon]